MFARSCKHFISDKEISYRLETMHFVLSYCFFYFIVKRPWSGWLLSATSTFWRAAGRLWHEVSSVCLSVCRRL